MPVQTKCADRATFVKLLWGANCKVRGEVVVATKFNRLQLFQIRWADLNFD